MFFPSHEGMRSVAKKLSDDLLIKIEETQAALHDSIERAEELVCEARQVMLRHRGEPDVPDGAEPPNPVV